MPPHKIARLGVARSFQNIELFTHLTVLENLMLGRHVHMRHGVLASMAWFGPARRQEIEHRGLVEEVIDLLRCNRTGTSRSARSPTGCRSGSSWAGRSAFSLALSPPR